MRKTRDGRRRFSREYKVAAVRRVLEGEEASAVARDLGIKAQVLWRWRKIVAEKGEDFLYELGRPSQWQTEKPGRPGESSWQRRIAELERLVGRQQMEIRFLDRALHRVEEQRQKKRDDGGGASSKR